MRDGQNKFASISTSLKARSKLYRKRNARFRLRSKLHFKTAKTHWQAFPHHWKRDLLIFEAKTDFLAFLHPVMVPEKARLPESEKCRQEIRNRTERREVKRRFSMRETKSKTSFWSFSPLIPFQIGQRRSRLFCSRSFMWRGSHHSSSAAPHPAAINSAIYMIGIKSPPGPTRNPLNTLRDLNYPKCPS